MHSAPHLVGMQKVYYYFEKKVHVLSRVFSEGLCKHDKNEHKTRVGVRYVRIETHDYEFPSKTTYS